ncbi:MULTISPECIES: Rieske (2Fe-2S) protein [Streptomyces]|uniref:Cytochrome bc1 complex Rieske iron-sulfur subunit n=1 Tax=Streptomyces dengpaensis TaxID=2049881 RepID=A0ABN5HYY2_9ACTN|nr:MULTISPECIES: Rieske (2Fe-2S) protein [Streptomyces]AVH55823.1 Rieske (2Fe-2S) protein [Streptomyces dengpaensis]PIB12077.1 hypothetical protein B1C81_02545 [Streptomyces sp. HG99]
MAETSGIPGDVNRRTVVAGVGTAGLAAALTACGTNDKEQAPSQNTATPTQSGAPSKAAGTGGTVLGKTSDIPVGGGMVYAKAKVVVTQPTSGDFKGFSAICTHQGCTVNKVQDGEILCPCHKSKFKITDGGVAEGPATKPLPAAEVTVADGTIRLA